MSLPTDAQTRKAIPIYSGCIAYFPNALAEVARLSKIGNDQHNPGKPLHWDRTKSQDELDALMRHLTDHAAGVPMDTDGVPHLAKVAWRALAMLEKSLETQAVPKDTTDYGPMTEEEEALPADPFAGLRPSLPRSMELVPLAIISHQRAADFFDNVEEQIGVQSNGSYIGLDRGAGGDVYGDVELQYRGG